MKTTWNLGRGLHPRYMIGYLYTPPKFNIRPELNFGNPELNFHENPLESWGFLGATPKMSYDWIFIYIYIYPPKV